VGDVTYASLVTLASIRHRVTRSQGWCSIGLAPHLVRALFTLWSAQSILVLKGISATPTIKLATLVNNVLKYFFIRYTVTYTINRIQSSK